MNERTSNYPAKQRYWGAIAERYDDRNSGTPIRRLIAAREFSLLEKIVKTQVPRNSRILDAPTGTGRFLPLLRDFGHRVTGIDISSDMLKHQNELLRNGGASLVRGDCEVMPFESGAFDYVVSVRFMGHIPPTTRARVLREFKRVAKRGMILGFPVLNPYTRLKFEIGNARYRHREGRPRPWWPATPDSLAEELKSAELRVVYDEKLLGPFSQIVMLYLEPADFRTHPFAEASRSAQLTPV